MAKRSLTASPEGLTKAREALTEKGRTVEGAVGEENVSRSTIMKFFAGKPVDRLVFVKICKSLNLNWQEIAGSVQNSVPHLEVLASDDSSLSKSSGDDITTLVQEIRQRCHTRIEQYNETRLGLKLVPIDRLYVDVYVLDSVSSEVRKQKQKILEQREKAQDQKSSTWLPKLLKAIGLSDGYKRRGEIEAALESLNNLDRENLKEIKQDLVEEYQRINEPDRLGFVTNKKRGSGIEVAKNKSKLIVLGKPGAGKTTFLKHLALACSRGDFKPDLIPILIELRELEEIEVLDLDLVKIIIRELKVDKNSDAQKLLEQGKVLVLLDGLDEVSAQRQKIIQNQVRDLSRQYNEIHLIITCRTQVLKSLFQKFHYVEIADFNQVQVEVFTKNWFAVSTATFEEGEKLQIQFLTKLQKNNSVAELAVTPILLGLTCLVFEENQDLPSKRSELYQQGLDLLLKSWDETKGIKRHNERYRNLSLDEKRHLLGELAIQRFEQKDNFVIFEENEIVSYISNFLSINTEDSESVLEAIEAQHGLLIEQAWKLWSFSHLTFHEYFVAQYIINNAKEQNLASYLFEPHWREVFLLVAEIAPSADSLVQFMKQQIDQSTLSLSGEAQKFLAWVNKKSLDVNLPYKRGALRAFYFALDRAFNRDQSSDYRYDYLDFLNCVFEFASIIDSTIDDTLRVVSRIDRAKDEPEFHEGEFKRANFLVRYISEPNRNEAQKLILKALREVNTSQVSDANKFISRLSQLFPKEESIFNRFFKSSFVREFVPNVLDVASLLTLWVNDSVNQNRDTASPSPTSAQSNFHIPKMFFKSALNRSLNSSYLNRSSKDLVNLERRSLLLWLARALGLDQSRECDFALAEVINISEAYNCYIRTNCIQTRGIFLRERNNPFKQRVLGVHDFLQEALEFSPNSELKSELLQLKEQLPDKDSLEAWWQVGGAMWSEKLRKLTIKHRDIGYGFYDWGIVEEEQEELLKQYYDVNKLLVDCLNLGKVSLQVRQEIEETLFLPIHRQTAL